MSDPLVEHFADAVRSATLFHQRWGWWPMAGWLHQFGQLALTCRDQQGRPLLSTYAPPPFLHRSNATRRRRAVTASAGPQSQQFSVSGLFAFDEDAVLDIRCDSEVPPICPLAGYAQIKELTGAIIKGCCCVAAEV